MRVLLRRFSTTPSSTDVIPTSWRASRLSVWNRHFDRGPRVVLEEPLWSWNTDEGKTTFWHSSAHLLGNAIEIVFPGALLCDGPAVSPEGFFYEFLPPPSSRACVSSDSFPALTELMMGLAKQKRKFERLTVSPQAAREMFAYNPFKLELLDAIERRGEPVILYRCGDFIDLCRGPHIPNTGKVRWVKLTGCSTSIRVGNDLLHRIHGISFPSSEAGIEWEQRKADAERRDHRNVGVRQNLFMFNEFALGSAFFLPDGTYVYNRLLDLLRHEYRVRGFDEVITPMLYSQKLWEISGHWDHYKEDMFFVKCSHHHDQKDEAGATAKEPELLGLKPMNCPAHCLIFGHTSRSHNELPLRLADFGALHRNERTGALSGLTRVRKFSQDDAHIFCTDEQLTGELQSSIEFLQSVYRKLGFSEFSLRLSTRPERYVGDLSLWDTAEASLRETLDQSGSKWSLSPGDGAFYGPKVDVFVRDAMQRMHQCGTVQLDFQLPRRFNLSYVAADQTLKVPVMIHRAILGSVERMFAVLSEHCGGRWPFWLNPRGVACIPVSVSHTAYAKNVVDALKRVGVRAFLFSDGATLPKRVRTAQVQQYSYIIVVGNSEVEAGTVSVRLRDQQQEQPQVMPLQQFVDKCAVELNAPFCQ